MPGAPDVGDDMKIHEARNQLAAIIAKARYFGGVTYLTNRGERVAAVVSVEDAEWLKAERAAGRGPQSAGG